VGYEIRLVIVEPSKTGYPELKRSEKGEIDGKYVYFPYAKKNGKAIKTGRTEFYCRVIAQIDLCVFCGKAIEALDAKNQKQSKADKKNVYYYYETDGNTRVDEDKYGAKRNPIPIKKVLKAVESSHMESIHNDDFRYRRSEWAVALLKSMINHQGEDLSVILEAY